MAIEQLLRFVPVYRNLRNIAVGSICELHNDTQLYSNVTQHNEF